MNCPNVVISLLAMVSLLSGCAISKNVVPVDSGTRISKVYLLENKKVLMDGLLPELESQLNEMGFETEVYQGDRPAQAKHYMIYSANWQWDMAMYLTYFHASIYEDGRFLGEVEYDAKMGGANMSKFGKTGDKIRPLLEELFAKVDRRSTVEVMGTR